MRKDSKEKVNCSPYGSLNLINGRHEPAKGGEWIDLIDPSKGKSYGKIPRSGKDDVDQAVKSASHAFEEWSSWSAEKRSECIDRLADKIQRMLGFWLRRRLEIMGSL